MKPDTDSNGKSLMATPEGVADVRRFIAIGMTTQIAGAKTFASLMDKLKGIDPTLPAINIADLPLKKVDWKADPKKLDTLCTVVCAGNTITNAEGTALEKTSKFQYSFCQKVGPTNNKPVGCPFSMADWKGALQQLSDFQSPTQVLACDHTTEIKDVKTGWMSKEHQVINTPSVCGLKPPMTVANVLPPVSAPVSCFKNKASQPTATSTPVKVAK